MSASASPSIIYGIKPAYASSGLRRTYNKQVEVIRFIKQDRSLYHYKADEIYRYNSDGTFKTGKSTDWFMASHHLVINERINTASPNYNMNYSLFLDQDIAYISKVQSVNELKHSYTAELNRLQELFETNVPNLDGHNKAVQAIKEEHPEKFI